MSLAVLRVINTDFVLVITSGLDGGNDRDYLVCTVIVVGCGGEHGSIYCRDCCCSGVIKSCRREIWLVYPDFATLDNL